VFITILVLCHLQTRGQALTNAAPSAAQEPASAEPASALPDDPSQEALPVAEPEPIPQTGFPVELDADHQAWAKNIWTGSGRVEVRYRDYTLHADRVTYNQSTTELEADGNLEVAGGPNDVLIYASSGDMRLNMHTARFYNVHGSQGVRTLGRTTVYSTTSPFLFTGRVLLQTGEGRYRIVDGTMTNCKLPRPDWQLFSRSIKLEDGQASSANMLFKVLGVPVFYLPYLRHPVDQTGRQSGFLIPVISTGSTIKGYTFGEQYYWAINRSMDMIAGSEYFSRRGWAPNGDFRYRGRGLDHFTARMNALFDRGFVPSPSSPPTANCLAKPTSAGLVNQGGLDISALGRKDLTSETRLASNIEYLSCYVYRLVFNDNYWQAVDSEVQSNISLTHAHNGFVPSATLDRFQGFASPANGDEVRILRLPSLRFDVLDRPLGDSGLYWGLGSSLAYLTRAEAAGIVNGTSFHARNVGRYDLYPHLSWTLSSGGWSLTPEIALRETAYTISQNPDLSGKNGGTPSINHDSLARSDFEASVDLRPPAIERDFDLPRWNRVLRHVIEPEITYRYVTGIGDKARNVLLIDTTDIATNTNEAGFSLTQRFYLRPDNQKPCVPQDDGAGCPQKPREWASWQIAQKIFIDPNFGGALIPGRRNVFDSTLDLSAIAFLTQPSNISPIISRLRFEAIDNLRVEWDLDYDSRAGHLGADNLFAGYSWGRTTIGIGHALLNAVDEKGSAASIIQSQQVQPYLSIGKPNGAGFNFAANSGYDFVHGSLQYAGLQAVYNWNCCGVSFGYRRFALGTVRDETQWLYSVTLANFGSVGDIRRSNTAFRDPTLPPAF
jgi:LPS-assembly protein